MMFSTLEQYKIHTCTHIVRNGRNGEDLEMMRAIGTMLDKDIKIVLIVFMILMF